jgi:protein-L-isoaspartate(D-aspartate) O-methyltransferase
MRAKVYFIITLIILFAFSAGCGGDRRSSKPDSGRDFKTMREKMVETQIKGRGVRDERVLSAMLKVERHRFVPKEYQAQAYADQPLPIGEGQTISQPYIVAYMAECLELSPADRVLEIGTGSGYSAAVLSRIAAQVYTVERFASLALSAGEHLRRLGYDNISILVADGTLGWPGMAPYDAIIVTAGAPRVPKPLLEQLAVGGRLVLPVGPDRLGQILIRVRRKDEDEYLEERLLAVQFVPLVGAEGW